MSDCCNSFGGRITITAGNEKLVARGEITIRPGTREVTGEANQDGSAYYTSRPTLVGGECSLQEPCSGSWDERLKNCSVNITVVEDDNSRQHLFTGSRLVGNASYALSSGEVSGISWAGGTYQRV